MAWPPLLWMMSGALTFLGMEPWAALLHGCVWHRQLWCVHRSHHRGRGDVADNGAPRATWQANDALSLLHAPVATALILYGCVGAPSVARECAYGAGLGMTLFGAAYVLVHDGLAHGRLPVRFLLRCRFLRRVAAAHRVHHRTGGAPFGLFWGPWTLPQAVQVRQAAQRSRR